MAALELVTWELGDMSFGSDNTPSRASHNFHKDKPEIIELKPFLIAASLPDTAPAQSRELGGYQRPSFVGGLNTAPIAVGGGLIGLVLGEILGSGDLVQWLLAGAGVLVSLFVSYEERKRRGGTGQ
jgi:hypothetical protein